MKKANFIATDVETLIFAEPISYGFLMIAKLNYRKSSLQILIKTIFRSRSRSDREKQLGQHLEAGDQGGDRVQPEVRSATRLGSHPAPPFLHCPGTCPQTRSQAKKGESNRTLFSNQPASN